jgi:multicomponent Na+:H+ antiporter subunit B
LRKWALLSVIIVGALLLWAEGDIPPFGDPDTPANTYVARYYIENAYPDTDMPNIVTAILADYRGYDTLGEATVIFSASMSVLLLLRRGGRL